MNRPDSLDIASEIAAVRAGGPAAWRALVENARESASRCRAAAVALLLLAGENRGEDFIPQILARIFGEDPDGPVGLRVQYALHRSNCPICSAPGGKPCFIETLFLKEIYSLPLPPSGGACSVRGAAAGMARAKAVGNASAVGAFAAMLRARRPLCLGCGTPCEFQHTMKSEVIE